MGEVDVIPASASAPREGLVTITHVIYALHALAVFIGITSAVTIVGAFVFGLPSLVAVILNYVKRDEARGTWLEGHFRWQIRTFWFALMWVGVCALLVITIIGILAAWPLAILVGLWVTYRVVRGWWVLGQRRPLAPMAP